MAQQDKQPEIKITQNKPFFLLAFPWVLYFAISFLFSTAAYFAFGAFPVISNFVSPAVFTGLSAYIGFLVGHSFISLSKDFFYLRDKQHQDKTYKGVWPLLRDLFSGKSDRKTVHRKPMSKKTISKAYSILGCIVGATVSAFIVPGILSAIIGPVLGIFTFHEIARGILDRRLKSDENKADKTIELPSLVTVLGLIGVAIGTGIGIFCLPGLYSLLAAAIGAIVGGGLGFIGDKLDLMKRFFESKWVKPIIHFFEERLTGRIVGEALGGTGFLVGDAIGVLIAIFVAPSPIFFTMIVFGCGIMGFLLGQVSGFFIAEKADTPSKKDTRAIGATCTTTGALVGLAMGSFMGSLFPGFGTAIGAAIGAGLGMALGGLLGTAIASFMTENYQIGMGTAIGSVAGANIGIMVGGFIGTSVMPVFGTALGAMIGSIVGTTAGAIIAKKLFRFDEARMSEQRVMSPVLGGRASSDDSDRDEDGFSLSHPSPLRSDGEESQDGTKAASSTSAPDSRASGLLAPETP